MPRFIGTARKNVADRKTVEHVLRTVVHSDSARDTAEHAACAANANRAGVPYSDKTDGNFLVDTRAVSVPENTARPRNPREYRAVVHRIRDLEIAGGRADYSARVVLVCRRHARVRKATVDNRFLAVRVQHRARDTARAAVVAVFYDRAFYGKVLYRRAADVAERAQ